jgi:sulfur-carrier protein
MIRAELLALPPTLARVDGEVNLDVERQAKQRSVLDTARGSLSDRARYDPRRHATARRPFLRFLACEENLFRELTGSIVARVIESKLIVSRGERRGRPTVTPKYFLTSA